LSRWSGFVVTLWGVTVNSNLHCLRGAIR
jgi:hypothetical protein